MSTHDRSGALGLKALALVLLFPALGAFSTWVDAEPASSRKDRSQSSDDNVHKKVGIMDAYSCEGCHAAVEAARSWSADRSMSFYRSSTMDAWVGPPDGTSLWCLQCHDGNMAAGGGGPSVGGDGLSNDHPVSFVYDDALVSEDGELHSPSMPSPLGGTIASDLLEDGKMQCSACHDFHSERSALLKTDRQTSLCLACHIK